MWSWVRLPTWHGWGLLLPVAPLCAAGVLTIHITVDHDPARELAPALKQLIFVGNALVIMLITLAIGYQRLGRISTPLFVIVVGMLVYIGLDKYVDVPLVREARACRRWIFLPGIQVQPSELMKIVYVLGLAWYLRYRRNYRTLGGLIAPFAITLVPMALILTQPDLGTVLLFLPVLFAMLFVAGAKLKHLTVIILLGLMCMPVFWFKIKGYQRLRVAGVFLQSPAVREYFKDQPERWDRLCPAKTNKAEWRKELTDWTQQTGYQLVHSKTAVGSGGLWGQGWGKGPFSEHDLLPERENDFIFAMVAHQWGLAGGIALLLCYALIVAIGCDVATLTNDPFGRLLAVGLSTLIAVQALTNLWMAIGLGPITGVTLPFVSAGGTSMVSSFVCVGLLLSVAHRREKLIARNPFEFDDEAERYEQR
ncbi:MAG TPA: FtsW/RodA/SpoVE family cell cycle protein [Phycisphaerae bacterium]|nr:FtsW/RodA/SpoVE family cell cycle protein [Phycisphaerae bacterium]HRY69521.1 FtsW/RodA/SpoVE family cell cycle protein [Phycisphaerae bacterium]HSA28175.1 FtsW/RodA/SpoVE family cell cycle protein [Phycisphaerae bacterium]